MNIEKLEGNSTEHKTPTFVVRRALVQASWVTPTIGIATLPAHAATSPGNGGVKIDADFTATIVKFEIGDPILTPLESAVENEATAFTGAPAAEFEGELIIHEYVLVRPAAPTVEIPVAIKTKAIVASESKTNITQAELAVALPVVGDTIRTKTKVISTSAQFLSSEKVVEATLTA